MIFVVIGKVEKEIFRVEIIKGGGGVFRRIGFDFFIYEC